MDSHYPLLTTERNRQGLHYSVFCLLSHRCPIDQQGYYFATSGKSQANPLSRASSQLVAIDGEAHEIYIDRASECMRALQDFLQSVEANLS